jgi:CheY-like chemotaxis protein
VQATSASQALEACADQSPDLFLLDIAMPETNGLHLLELLRDRLHAYRTPAVFLTAFPREEYLEECRRLGASDFLVKSDISLQDLLAKIERRLDTSAPSAPVSSRSAPRASATDDDQRRHLRPALRRWRPTSPRPAITRLFSLACVPEIRDADIIQLSRLDPGIEGTLREASGSGPFRALAPAKNAEEALERLGSADAMRLLLARAVIDHAGKGIPARGDMVRLWGHAIATGLLAERLATPTAFPAPLAAYLSGLCSELPSVFGILALEEDYTDIRAQAWEDNVIIQMFLADVFETTPAHLALECAKALEVPEAIWKTVVDLQAGYIPTSLWEPGPASRILDCASVLALGLNQIWNPCVHIRTLSCEESLWWRDPGDLERDLPGIASDLQKLLLWEDVLPELGGQTQALPSGEERKILYLRSATVFQPDPIESVLRNHGHVEIADTPSHLGSGDDAVRVAAVEPDTPLWNRLLEIPRRTILLHRGELQPDTRLGPHVDIRLPATISTLETLLRPR